MEWMLLGVLAVIAWVACGLLAAGFTFAYWQDRFPEDGDLRTCLYLGLCTGPIALVCSILDGDYKYGWRLWRKK